MRLWAKIGIGVVGGCALLALIGSLGRTKPAEVDVRVQLHVARDDATTYQATVLAPSGLSRAAYEQILAKIYEANMGGRAGFIQVFDDPEAEKLAMCWTTRETTIQEDTFCSDHIMAQAHGTAPQ